MAFQPFKRPWPVETAEQNDGADAFAAKPLRFPRSLRSPGAAHR
jgi:hypothetical protein